jgi:hypothetical protein
VDSTGTYWVKTTNPGGCEDYDTIQVTVFFPPNQGVGLVSIDTSTIQGNNQIIWDTTLYPANVSLVNFQRELTTNNYITVGSAPYTAGSWTDMVSSSTQTWRYKVSLVDTCGNESSASAYHQSIHSWVMPISGGFNIEWTAYLVEGDPNPVQQYNIYVGPSLNALSLLTFVSGNVYTYTPSVIDSVYVIGAKLSSKGLSTEALSNPVSPQDTLGIEEWGNTISFDIYPNPVINTLTIQTENVKEVQLMDAVGRIIFTTNNKTIDCTELAKGIYLIKVRTTEGYGTKQFVKQ